MSSLVALAKRSAMWGIALVLVALAGSTTAKADSITYDVTGTFSSFVQPVTLNGEYTWDTNLGAATGFLFNLTHSADSATCSDATGTMCTFSLSIFNGDGSFAGYVEGLLSILDPNAPQFVLQLVDPSGNLSDAETLNLSPTVRVPEPAEISFLLLGLLIVVVGMRRASSLGLVGN